MTWMGRAAISGEGKQVTDIVDQLGVLASQGQWAIFNQEDVSQRRLIVALPEVTRMTENSSSVWWMSMYAVRDAVGAWSSPISR